VIAGLAWLATSQAGAQEAVVELPPILVTAQKVTESEQQVPAAMTVVGSDELALRGIHDFSELSQYTPGFWVNAESPNNPVFTIRGLNANSPDSFAEARVSVYQDGVSISKLPGSFLELYDLERVEVVKGPQPTLFGRDSLIGGVNIVQRKADRSAFDAYLRGGVGNFDAREAEGAINLPLSERYAVRLAGRSSRRNGYVDNAIGPDLAGRDVDALRLSLSANPIDALTADLIFNLQHDDTTGTAYKSGTFLPTDPRTGEIVGDIRPWSTAAIRAPDDFQGGRGLGLDRRIGDATALLHYELSAQLSLDSISAFRKFDAEEVYDIDGMSLNFLTAMNDAVGEQTSQELRLNFDADRLRGFVGGNYFHETGHQRIPLQFDERLSVATVTGMIGREPGVPAPESAFDNDVFVGALLQGVSAALSGGQLALSSEQAQAIAGNLSPRYVEQGTNSTRMSSYDLFGDVTYELTERWDLTAGLRYTWEQKRSGFASSTVGGRNLFSTLRYAAGLAAQGQADEAQRIVDLLAGPDARSLPDSELPNLGTSFQPTVGNGDTVYSTRHYDGWSGRLAARYELDELGSVYATYGRGRRPPVLVAASPTTPYGAPRFTPVPAETVNSYELGFKTLALKQTLRYDAAVYWYDYHNFQTVEQQGTIFVTTNAGKAQSYGLEQQLEWLATADLSLTAAYAYNHARFDGGIYDGNHFKLAPDHSYSLTASWRLPLLQGDLLVCPSYSWHSKIYFDDNNDEAALQQGFLRPDNQQDEVQKAYGIANLRLFWSRATSAYRLEAFVSNLTDERYLVDAGNTGDGLGYPTFVAGPPRMGGIAVRYEFGAGSAGTSR